MSSGRPNRAHTFVVWVVAVWLTVDAGDEVPVPGRAQWTGPVWPTDGPKPAPPSSHPRGPGLVGAEETEESTVGPSKGWEPRPSKVDLRPLHQGRGGQSGFSLRRCCRIQNAQDRTGTIRLGSIGGFHFLAEIYEILVRPEGP